MKKNVISKIFLAVIFLVAVVSFFIAMPKKSDAGGVNFKVKVSSEKVKKGEEIPITVTVTGDTLIKSVDAYVSYDETMLEFVGAEGDCVTGSSGVLRIADNYEDGGVKSAVYNVTFRALSVGETSILVQETFVEEESSHQVNTALEGSAKITIMENGAESQDATLKRLEVYPEGLTPEFTPEQASYSLQAEKDVTELIISAVPTDKESVVTLEGNENLSDGENKITITVTSMSGEDKVYTITVHR